MRSTPSGAKPAALRASTAPMRRAAARGRFQRKSQPAAPRASACGSASVRNHPRGFVGCSICRRRRRRRPHPRPRSCPRSGVRQCVVYVRVASTSFIACAGLGSNHPKSFLATIFIFIFGHLRSITQNLFCLDLITQNHLRGLFVSVSLGNDFSSVSASSRHVEAEVAFS